MWMKYCEIYEWGALGFSIVAKITRTRDNPLNCATFAIIKLRSPELICSVRNQAKIMVFVSTRVPLSAKYVCRGLDTRFSVIR